VRSPQGAIQIHFFQISPDGDFGDREQFADFRHGHLTAFFKQV
jgi:hypothetical protein